MTDSNNYHSQLGMQIHNPRTGLNDARREAEG